MADDVKPGFNEGPFVIFSNFKWIAAVAELRECPPQAISFFR